MSHSNMKKLGLTSIVFLLIAVVALVTYSYGTANLKKKDITKQDLEIFLDKKYSQHYKLVKLFASDTILQVGETVDKTSFLNNVASSLDEISYAFVVDNLGNLRAYSSLDNTKTINRSYFNQIQGESWFQKMLKNKFKNYFDKGLVGASISKFTIDMLTKKSGHYFSAPFYDNDSRVVGHLIYFVDINMIDKELTAIGVDIKKSFVALENEVVISNNIIDELGVYFTYEKPNPADIIKNPIFYAALITFFAMFSFAYILFVGFGEDESLDVSSILQKDLDRANEKIEHLELLVRNNDVVKNTVKTDSEIYNLVSKQIQTKRKMYEMLINKNINIKDEIGSRLESLWQKESDIVKSCEIILNHQQAVIQDINKTKFHIKSVYDYLYKLLKLKKNLQVELMNAELKVQRNEIDPKLQDLIDVFKEKIEEISISGLDSSSKMKQLLDQCNSNQAFQDKEIQKVVNAMLSTIEMTKKQRLHVYQNLKSLDKGLNVLNKITVQISNSENTDQNNHKKRPVSLLKVA